MWWVILVMGSMTHPRCMRRMRVIWSSTSGELMTTVWTAMADELRQRYGVTSNERPIAAAGERLE